MNELQTFKYWSNRPLLAADAQNGDVLISKTKTAFTIVKF